MSSVRLATSEDKEAIFLLARDMATSSSVSPDGFGSAFESILSAPNVCLAVTQQGDQVIGYLLGSYRPCFYASGNVGWVEEIVVEQKFRRRGVGRLLMEHFEVWATDSDCRLVALATRRASEFYLALDYKESATYFKKQLTVP